MRLDPSLVVAFGSFVPPGVVAPDGACLRVASNCVLDLLFGRLRSFDFGRETREEDRERTDGVVGADRPSIYETWDVESGRASGSERGSLDVNGARVRWLRLLEERP